MPPARSCLAVVSDLIFSTRIASTAEAVGVGCTVARSVDSAESILAGEEPPGLLLVDLTIEGADPVGLIRRARGDGADRRIVAFVPHVQRELADAARQAGADEVLPRSAFVQRLPELLAGA